MSSRNKEPPGGGSSWWWSHARIARIKAVDIARLAGADRGERSQPVVVLDVAALGDEYPATVHQRLPQLVLEVPACRGDATVAVAVFTVRVAAVGSREVVPLAVRVVVLPMAVAAVAELQLTRLRGRGVDEADDDHEAEEQQRPPGHGFVAHHPFSRRFLRYASQHSSSQKLCSAVCSISQRRCIVPQ